jgi:hypothetical protein
MDYRLSRDQLVSWGFPAYSEGNRMFPVSQRYINGLGSGHTLRSGTFRGSLGLPPTMHDRRVSQGRALLMGAARGTGDEGLAIALADRMAGGSGEAAIAFRGKRALMGLGSTAGRRTCDVVGGLLNAGSSVAGMFGGSVSTAEAKQRAQTAEKAGVAMGAGAGVVDTICGARFSADNQASGNVGGGDVGAPEAPPPVQAAGISTNTLLLGGLGVAAVVGAVLLLRK